MTASTSLLSIQGLSLAFASRQGLRPVTYGVDLTLRSGRCLGLVGESGSGKSLTALAIMRLLPPRATVTAGRIMLDGRDLLAVDDAAMRRIRGREIGMIYQEPMTALNPVLTVGRQIGECLEQHLGLGGTAADRRAIELLSMVGVPDPAGRLRVYPHELSGGLRQRVMIAIALSCDPKLVIADEPTTALDVTIQAQILDLLRRLRGEIDTAILLITHDLGVVAEIADEIAVMYAGHVVEAGPAAQVFARPAHPYTEGLLRSIPRIDVERQRLVLIPGSVPRPGEIVQGCPFAPRCPERVAVCGQEMPPFVAVDVDHHSACWVRAPMASAA